MLLVYHDYHIIYKVVRDGKTIAFTQSDNLVDAFQNLANSYPDELLIWCSKEVEENLNIKALETVFHHNGIMASYSPNGQKVIHPAIGYVDPTPFIKVIPDVTYPTWMMSASAGGVNTRVIINFSKEKKAVKNFELYLNLMARKGMWQGLCCFSEPLLLCGTIKQVKHPEIRNYQNVFRFVSFHYKKSWLFFLFLIIAYYDKKLPVWAFISSLFTSKSSPEINCMQGIEVLSSKKNSEDKLDVLIPTIGREKYLYDFLSDLKDQTYLPEKVIIIEQNPNPESISELDYLKNESWPFLIKHVFTHQAGACNARNLALKEVTGDWVFFADDDIRIENDFLAKGLESLRKYGEKAATFFCYREGETPNFTYPLQWGTFGSGCSIVKSEALKGIFFDEKFEFGFGEDGDFGMQLRNKGTDVIYFDKPSILHLKAPIGGFRTKPVLAWAQEKIQPKPSPTIMLYQLKNLTLEQQRSEKIKLYMNFYKHQPIKNPLSYIRMMNKQWAVSRKWALKLMNND